MKAKLQELAQQVDTACKTIDRLASENQKLKTEVTELRQKLAKIGKEYDSIRLNSSDKSDAIKDKLSGILERLNQLEELSPQVFS